ncbi:MAG: type II secretion system minor pseudopilin GspK [Deltaproteobacteria bacterium]|nr:type II secretion system minor pseudopilin GspK [Deltaproteobacteria bacterium]MBW2118835.1 type II secretion system minor pseudopilin GspK [Deltaproteobacteria bacterium]
MFSKNERGFALILTILIISLIVALTLQFNTTMRSDLQSAATLKDGVSLTSVARSGFAFASAVLLEDASETAFDSLNEAWADPELLSSSFSSLFDDVSLDLRIVDHLGRININRLIDENGEFDAEQKNLMTRLLSLEQFSLDSEEVSNIIDAIKDWIDTDDEVTRFGAENAYYGALEQPYSCKNGDLDFPEELLFVRGITSELFYGTREKSGISRYLTTYGQGKININTADPIVLGCLSDQIDQEMVDNMVEYRTDEKNDLEDVKWYNKVPGMSDITIDPGLVTTSSTNFEIKSEGVKEAMRKRITAMIERKDGTFHVLSWKTE